MPTALLIGSVSPSPTSWPACSRPTVYCAALYAREQTGAGQIVDIGMLDATAALLTYQAGNYFTTGETPGRLGNRHPTIVPYEVFDTSDGQIVVAVGNDEMWRRLCAAAKLTSLAPTTGSPPIAAGWSITMRSDACSDAR